MAQIRAVIAALAAGLALSACAAAPTAENSPEAAAAPAVSAAPEASPAPANTAAQQRDLTPQEKKIIVDAVAPSLRDAGAAKYHWAKFPVVPQSDTVAYCATVEAKSPYAAYDGRQAYIVDAKVSGGHITAASMGLIVGGKDIPIVSGMCAKHGLDPNKAS